MKSQYLLWNMHLVVFCFCASSIKFIHKYSPGLLLQCWAKSAPIKNGVILKRMGKNSTNHNGWSAVCTILGISWWSHQMETFSALLALRAGNSPVRGKFRTQRPVTRNFDIFFDLRLNKRLSKQSRGWRFQTPWRSLWRHCNVYS